MICRNCKFILQGSEKFCPDCGQACNENPTTEKDEKSTAPSILYSSDEADIDSPIFRDAPQQDEKPPRKKTSAPAFLIVLLIICVLTVGGFTAIEYYDLAPVIKDYISPGTTDESTAEEESTTHESAYSDSFGIVSPDISFSPTICYVASDKALALRKGPDNSYAMLSLVDSGTQLHIIGGSHTHEEWVYVHIPSEEAYGWLSSSFLRQSLPIQNNEPSVTEATSTESTTEQQTTAETTKDAA